MDEMEIFCFEHIAAYYWNRYATMYFGTFERNRDGQKYVVYKELSSNDDDAHVELSSYVEYNGRYYVDK